MRTLFIRYCQGCQLAECLLSHVVYQCDILGIGVNVNQLQRAKFNLKSTNNPIPILRGTSKDHKIPDDPIIGPDLRPIEAAKIGPNTSVAQIACRLLRGLADSMTDTCCEVYRRNVKNF